MNLKIAQYDAGEISLAKVRQENQEWKKREELKKKKGMIIL